MRLWMLAVSLVLSTSLAAAEPRQASRQAPELLTQQVAHLVALLRDSYATGYPEGTLAQEVGIGQDRKLALAVFTIEAFGGGNNHTQFLAVFEHESGEHARQEHYSLVDVMPIGGKGWRAIERLQVTANQDGKTGSIHFAIPALKNGLDDAANFPTRPAVIRLVLDKGRLSEPAAR